MKKFLKDNNFENIDFLHNNSIEVENKIICGTRGWNINEPLLDNSKKILAREALRLELSLQDAIKKIENTEPKEIIEFMHYPPITLQNLNTDFMPV